MPQRRTGGAAARRARAVGSRLVRERGGYWRTVGRPASRALPGLPSGVFIGMPLEGVYAAREGASWCRARCRHAPRECKGPAHPVGRRGCYSGKSLVGGADGNRTRAVCLGSRSSAIELQPRAVRACARTRRSARAYRPPNPAANLTPRRRAGCCRGGSPGRRVGRAVSTSRRRRRARPLRRVFRGAREPW